MTYRLIVFDFDGTLVNSTACIVQSMQAAARERGLVADPEAVRRRIGLPLESIVYAAINSSLSEADLSDIVQRFRRHFAVFETDPALLCLYPTVHDTLKSLHRRGCRLAIATSKPTNTVAGALQRLGIAPFFTVVVGEDQVVKGKPHPEMLERILMLSRGTRAETLMVGDTTFDIEMASAAGLASCAVNYGNHTTEQLTVARPTYLVDSPAALLALVDPR